MPRRRFGLRPGLPRRRRRPGRARTPTRAASSPLAALTGRGGVSWPLVMGSILSAAQDRSGARHGPACSAVRCGAGQGQRLGKDVVAGPVAQQLATTPREPPRTKIIWVD